MKHGKKILSFVVIAALIAFGFMGCENKTPNGINITQNVADNPVTAFGKIVDKQTRQGIAGATVYIKLNGQWLSAGTAADSSTEPNSTAGDFSFTFLPLSTTLPMVVKGPQGGDVVYATLVTTKTTGAAPNWMTNNQVSTDWGQIEMDRGVTATVYVLDSNLTSTTQPYLRKLDNSAIPIYVNLLGSTRSTLDILATRETPTSDKYNVVVPENSSVVVTVPALDTTGDGVVDYASSAVTINANGPLAGEGGLTTNIALTKITPNTALAIVADSIKLAGETTGGAAQVKSMGASDTIQYFFNMPVSAAYGSGTETLSYTDNFKTLTVAAVTAEIAVNDALTAGDTLLTLTPAAALTQNKVYTLSFNNLVLRTNAGAAADVALSGVGGGTVTGDVVVYATGAGTIGSTPVVTVDNRNFCNNGAIIVAGDTIVCGTADNTPRLVFPERVWGTYEVISYTVGATTTPVTNGPTDILGQNSVNGVLNSTCWWIQQASTAPAPQTGNCTGMATTGAKFAVNIATGGAPALMLDDTATTPAKVRLGFDVYDAEGNPNYKVANQLFGVQ